MSNRPKVSAGFGTIHTIVTKELRYYLLVQNVYGSSDMYSFQSYYPVAYATLEEALAAARIANSKITDLSETGYHVETIISSSEVVSIQTEKP